MNINDFSYQPSPDEIEKLYHETKGLKRGFLDCKVALKKAEGNFEQAKEIIQERQIFLF